MKTSGMNPGQCAEDLLVDVLGGKKEDVLFSSAIRPRTSEIIPVCPRCASKYSINQFPVNTPYGFSISLPSQ